MANERLRSSIAAAGFTYATLAEKIGVDQKTIERWVMTGRKPHTTNRQDTATALGCDEAYLWPEVLTDARTQAASEAELVRLYPTRGAVPVALWHSLIETATESIDLLAFAALQLFDTNPDLGRTLAMRAGNGVRVRVLLGDPDGAAVALRGEEEGIYGGLAERVRITLSHLRDLEGVTGAEIRLHDAALYTTILRCDTKMLANTHVYGSPAAANPVLHLQRVAGGRMFDTYQTSFERVWEDAKPYPFPPRGRRRR